MTPRRSTARRSDLPSVRTACAVGRYALPWDRVPHRWIRSSALPLLLLLVSTPVAAQSLPLLPTQPIAFTHTAAQDPPSDPAEAFEAAEPEADADVTGEMEGVTPLSTGSVVVEYYGLDAVGSVRVVFNANGSVLARADYTPFGTEHATTGNLPAQRFTGQERDHEAGKDYFGARYYQSRHGRFGTVDPLYVGAVRNPQRWNRYVYARNSPLIYVDPDGLCDRFAVSGTHFSCSNDATKDGGTGGNGGGGWTNPVDSPPPLWFPPRWERPDWGRGGGGGGGGGGNAGGGHGGDGDAEPDPDDRPGPDGECVPETPPGVSVRQNVRMMRIAKVSGVLLGPAAYGSAISLWINKVRPGGSWDYKTRGIEFENFGNFNYGATAEAIGIPLPIASRAAGLVQMLSGYRNPHSGNTRVHYDPHLGNAFGGAPHGDDVHDYFYVARGHQYASSGGCK